MNYLVFDEVVTRRVHIPESMNLKEAEEYLDCFSDPTEGSEVLHREVSEIVELQNSEGEPIEQNPRAFGAEAPQTVELKQGDWVLYKGKPREVYKFHPFGGPNCPTPELERDPRYDLIELMSLKTPVRPHEVQRMMVSDFHDYPEAPKEIVVVMEGGNILSVDNIPEGCNVKFLNFEAGNYFRDAADIEREGRTAYVDPDDGSVAEVLIYEGKNEDK